ncbi:hypothetical protein GCM10008018_21380 [Paenibacillus marchantiophytorum]|uniref:ABC transporter permease n=1 Tax=Paenibacillus marchantiophytorum TaxID=1619310 RepID=A0ABQ1EK81_9BACL|nr:ABC transporter permease [Paenibacillus marchantiophytorum]GFZ75852.1 hypothetical protein GCM10008018_21380 [Paenibacillus marchantiophytorum]
MNNLIKSEWYKLRMDRSFRMLILVYSALSLTISIIQYCFEMNASEKPQAIGVEVWMSAFSGNKFFLIIGLCILAGSFISSEYSIGVMKSMASSGNRRGSIFRAKLFVYALGGTILALLFPVINFAVATVLSGFGELPNEVIYIYVFRTLGLTVLYAAAYASIVLLFATLMAESGKTIAITLVFFLVIEIFFSLVGQYIPFVQKIYDYTVFKLLNDVGKVTLDDYLLMWMIFIPVITFVCFSIVGAWVYCRKEIK